MVHTPSSSTRFAHELPSPVPASPLDSLITAERARLYRQVLARRTSRIAVVVEDCYDPHNATAIIRTCDAFGVQDVHVVTSRNAFKVNSRVSQGSHRYVDLHVHAGIEAGYAALRAAGFRILVSDLTAGAVIGPQQLRPQLIQQPLALVFGNEGSGVSAAATAGADGFFMIPMTGFPQSLNVSVSVAVTLYALRDREVSDDLPGDLPPERQRALFEQWVRELKPAAAAAVMRQIPGRNGEELDSFRAT